MNILYLFIIIQILSMIINWKYFSIAYSKNGKWEDLKVSLLDLLWVVIPIFNTIFAIVAWLFHYPKVSNRNNNFYNKLFNIKK